MAPSTALCFALLGATLFALTICEKSKVTTPGAVVCAIISLAAATLAITSFSGNYYAVEKLGIPVEATLRGVPLGHMSPVTAIGIFFSAIAAFVIFLRHKSNNIDARISTFLSSINFILATVLTLAYVIGGPLLYDSGVIPPAFSTSITLLLVTMACFCLSLAEMDIKLQTAKTSSILLLILTVTTISLAAVGNLYFRDYQQKFTDRILENFEIITNQKKLQIVNWRKERIADGLLFSITPAFPLW